MAPSVNPMFCINSNESTVQYESYSTFSLFVSPIIGEEGDHLSGEGERGA